MTILTIEEIMSVNAAMMSSPGMVTLKTHGLTLDFAVVDVAPSLAREWLKLDKGNRPEKDSLIVKYSRDMAQGWWVFTGQAVEFSDTGALLDGHHRLKSIIRSDVTVPLLVISGFPDDTRDFIDIGKKRSVADQLAVEGYSNATALAAGARLALAWSTGRLGKKASNVISEVEVRQFVKENSYLITAAAFASLIRGRWHDIAPSVIVATMWGLAGAGHTEECARSFFLSLADMRTEGAGDPKYTLLRRIALARRDRQRIENGHLLVMVIKAFNADYEGKALHQLPPWAGGNKPDVPLITPPVPGR